MKYLIMLILLATTLHAEEEIRPPMSVTQCRSALSGIISGGTWYQKREIIKLANGELWRTGRVDWHHSSGKYRVTYYSGSRYLLTRKTKPTLSRAAKPVGFHAPGEGDYTLSTDSQPSLPIYYNGIRTERNKV